MKRAAKNVASTSIIKPSSLIEEVADAIRGGRLVPYGGRLLVGVSGGPDSVTLLHILSLLRHELGLTVMAAHFNHRIRRESSKDEEFVRKFAEHLRVEHMSEKAKGRPPKTGSLEDWARRERFDFLTRTAVKHKADAVALAHTADDQAETVLMRILRGSGLLGLKAMAPSRIIGSVRFVRPLLTVSKQQILAYTKENKLKFCIDQTNLKTDFFRNKIRLKLLPLLKKEYNANIARVLVNLSKSAGEDYEFLAEEALAVWKQTAEISPTPKEKDSGKSVLRLNADKLKKSHPALQRMVFRMAFEHLKGDLNQLSFDHAVLLERLLADPSGGVDLPGGISVTRTKQHLCFSVRK